MENKSSLIPAPKFVYQFKIKLIEEKISQGGCYDTFLNQTVPKLIILCHIFIGLFIEVSMTNYSDLCELKTTIDLSPGHQCLDEGCRLICAKKFYNIVGTKKLRLAEDGHQPRRNSQIR